jgi:hypothetical protein
MICAVACFAIKAADAPRKTDMDAPRRENAFKSSSSNGAAKKVSDASGEVDTLVMPSWDDTLLRGDVMLLPAASQGFYPTQDDINYLGDRDYPRRAYDEQGVDAVMQNASGIFAYQSGEQNFYTRNSRLFRPVNQTLGMFVPQQAITYEPEIFPGLAVSMDSSWPNIFTRTFDPNKAHVKAGPLAFDLLWVGAGLVWSDFKAPTNNFAFGQGDGVVGYIDLAMRGYLRVTDTLYFSWAANLIYLPWSNELAFRTMSGGWPQLGVEFFYQKRIAAWDIYLADEFFARPGFDMFADLELRGQDQAGRYMFGSYGRTNRTSFYDSGNVFFVNQADVRASRMFFDTDWRLWLNYQHLDFWRGWGFNNYQMRDSWEVALGYEGNAIPFAPRISYLMIAFDGYDQLMHQTQMQFHGRLSENVTLQSMIGYYFTSGFTPARDDVVWSVNLDHRFSAKGLHGVQAGQQVLTDSFSPETSVANFYRYFVTYQFLKRLNLSSYAQYSRGDRVIAAIPGPFTRPDFDNYLVGTSLEFQLFDYTRIVWGSAFERSDGDSGFPRTDRWIHRLNVLQQLASRLTVECGYQYESLSASPGFTEHMINFSVRRYF